jgi:fructosamine-3-kinase
MSRTDNTAGERLGQALAALHRITAPEFGWHRDNVIGATPQPNDPHSDWASFYRDMRLAPQLRLASRNGAPERLLKAGQKLMDGVERFFADYTPSPSLLHGDLWGGNWSALTDGTPVLFDPAVYYGDREADIAMTKLFGGFPESFYIAYGEAWPLDNGHIERVELYKLYHVLNHFNLFGGGYVAQAEGMLSRLLGQI